MAEKGAGQIVLTSRSGARGAAAEAVRDIESKGVRVIVAIGDITKEQDLHRILSEIRATMPRFRGVFHCAGMLDDGVLDQMDWTRFSAVTSPKVKGSWLLHTATAKDELDYFVLFSSILSLFGSAGQSNYASGNAYLDALTQHRRSAGLPAVALNWGPWAETGLATASGSRGEAIWKTRGTRYIPPEEGIKVLELALRRELDHVAVTITSWREFLQQFATPAPFYEELEKEAGPQRKRRRVMDAETTRARIQAVHGRERRELIVEIVRQEAADVLGAEATLDPSQRLGDLGLDSLMSVTLVNRLEPLLAILVPMAKVLAGPSVSELVDSLFPGLEDISTQESEVNVSKVHSNGSANGSAHPHFKRGSEWLVVTKPNPSAALRLFCFPFAGGGSAIYRLWNDTIHPSVEVIAVEPPGRLSRLAQAPVSNIQEFVAEAAKAIVPLLDKPFALFGHCLGTLTMVETARCLKRQKGELPVRMFVSGGRTPDSIHKEGAFERHLQERLLGSSRYDPFLPIHEQSDEVFADIIRLFQIDNTDEMLKSRELRELVLPVVRAEFKMASDYRYSREPVWDCPIICFNGANDAYVTREDILSWSRFTSSSFEAHIRRGGHFLLVDDREFLIRVINRELTAAAQEHIGPKPPRAEAMSVDARPVWTPLNGGHLNMTDSVHR
jgi:surfactin synthase thioesterase subunit/NAD(P)-dependent dehydrogenase (short-subunit alcohol dehydrogenase family)